MIAKPFVTNFAKYFKAHMNFFGNNAFVFDNEKMSN